MLDIIVFFLGESEHHVVEEDFFEGNNPDVASWTVRLEHSPPSQMGPSRNTLPLNIAIYVKSISYFVCNDWGWKINSAV